MLSYSYVLQKCSTVKIRPINSSIALWLFCLSLATTASAQQSGPVFASEARAIVAGLPAVVDARAVNGASLENKPVLVTFFASWCPPCREEFAHLNELRQEFADSDLQIIAINVHEAWDENDAIRMKKFIDTTKPSFPAVVGSKEIRDLFGGIDRIPTVYGFSRSGEHVYRFIHKRGSKKTNASFDELKNAAKNLLLTD